MPGLWTTCTKPHCAILTALSSSYPAIRRKDEFPGAELDDLGAPGLALGRKRPSVSGSAVDPLNELLVGFQVLGADA